MLISSVGRMPSSLYSARMLDTLDAREWARTIFSPVCAIVVVRSQLDFCDAVPPSLS